MDIAVSVCIANYNGVDIIDECITSVRQQRFNRPIEIIVHDDASTDESLSHLRSTHPDLLLIESPRNVGFCVANNRMVEKARGEYVLLLNNDAALMPDALSTLFEEAVELEQPAILTLPQFDYVDKTLVDRGCLLDLFFNPIPNLDENRHDVAMVIGACLWIPRELWHEVNGFPEWFGSIGEDLYLCCCARLAGHPVRAMDRSGYWHRIGHSFGGGRVVSGGLATTTQRRMLSERNKTYAMFVAMPTLALALLFPIHLLLMQIEGLVLAAMKRELSLYTRIYGSLPGSMWRERHRLAETRREVQASRKITLAQFLGPMSWRLRKMGMLFRHGIPRLS